LEEVEGGFARYRTEREVPVADVGGFDGGETEESVAGDGEVLEE
jgi:hypothetical protein